MKPILLILAGHSHPALRSRLGDFDRWFGEELDAELAVVDVQAGERLSPAGDYAGVVISGSAAMVSDREEWSERTAAWLGALEPGFPVLGVCYGHQLLAHALGAKVGRNPRGRQIGTRALALTAEGVRDPLLGRLSSGAPVQTTHQEAVLEPPPGSVVLGSTRDDPFHALHFGGRRWGLQFHPEFDATIMAAYLEALREPCEQEGIDVDRELAGLRASPEAAALLRHFSKLCSQDAG